MPGMYNPFEHPRRVRGAAAAPDARVDARIDGGNPRARARATGARRSRRRTIRCCATGTSTRWCLQHEYQHNETMLQTLQLKTGRCRIRQPCAGRGSGARASPSALRPPWCVSTAAIAYVSARMIALRAYDNERPRIAVELAPFWIDRAPVTNGEYLAFMDDGGYHAARAVERGRPRMARRIEGAMRRSTGGAKDGVMAAPQHGSRSSARSDRAR